MYIYMGQLPQVLEVGRLIAFSQLSLAPSNLPEDGKEISRECSGFNAAQVRQRDTLTASIGHLDFVGFWCLFVCK